MFMLYVIMLYVLMGHSTFYIYYIIIPKCACVCVCVCVCLCTFYSKTVNGNDLILFAS